MTTSRAQKTLDFYVDRFAQEYREARDEYLRLCYLFKDVCWYNFETACSSWRAPWRASVPQSDVHLQGVRIRQHWRRGHLMEHTTFPDWYLGPVDAAPPLPPEIVLVEMKAAKEYMHACERQMSAPLDFAPGGAAYQELVRTTLVGKTPPTEQCLYRKRKFSSASGSDE